jgi:PilZ domain
MNTDRRQLRVVPNKSVFIQFDHGSSGKALNLSEGGVGFESPAPVHQDGPIRFWFSLDLSDQIEAVGELAWSDAARKVGGMKFLEIDPSARGQIRNWISQNSKRDAIAANNSEAITTPAFSKATELVPLERYRSATRQQFIRGIFLGVLITSALAVPAVKYSGSRKQVAAPPPATSGQAAPANSEPRGVVSARVSVSDASRGFVAFPAGKTRRSTQAGDSPEDPLRSTLVKHRLESIDKPSVGTSPALSVAPAVSRETMSARTMSARKSVASPQQLWSAFQGGNVQAAVTLADLYLRGDGVPVNCDQARVLLLAASKKGNAQAIKKLRELDGTGCPAPAPSS